VKSSNLKGSLSQHSWCLCHGVSGYLGHWGRKGEREHLCSPRGGLCLALCLAPEAGSVSWATAGVCSWLAGELDKCSLALAG